MRRAPPEGARRLAHVACLRVVRHGDVAPDRLQRGAPCALALGWPLVRSVGTKSPQRSAAPDVAVEPPLAPQARPTPYASGAPLQSPATAGYCRRLRRPAPPTAASSPGP